MTSADVVVVGGGIIGLSAAWRLTQAGAVVRVFDDPTTDGAAWRAAAGMLTPVTEAYWGEDDLLALTVDSMRRWPGFAADLEAVAGVDVGFEQHGVLAVGLDADDALVVADLHSLHERHGLRSERLRSRACREREPLLAPGVRTGLFAPDDGSVDPRRVVAALRRAVADGGGTVEERPVTALVVADGAVTGVVAGDERVDAGGVVLAAGAWSPRVGGLPEVAVPPVRPVYGEVVRLRERTPGHVPQHTVRAVVHGRHVYVVPRAAGEIVVGATSVDRGYDTRVTAGGVHDLLRDAVDVVPALAEAELVEVGSGLRPGTPDNAPLIGWSAVERLLLATGHYRNGVLLAPATADAVARAVTGGAVPAVVERACRPDRFAPERVR